MRGIHEYGRGLIGGDKCNGIITRTNQQAILPKMVLDVDRVPVVQTAIRWSHIGKPPKKLPRAPLRQFQLVDVNRAAFRPEGIGRWDIPTLINDKTAFDGNRLQSRYLRPLTSNVRLLHIRLDRLP